MRLAALVFLTRQFSKLVDAGLSVLRALHVLSEQTGKPYFELIE